MSNILIIKHGSLGDIAQASGAIQDISENHKNDRIYLLTTKPYFELFKKNPFIHEVILDKRLPKYNLVYLYFLMRELKKHKFSRVLTFKIPQEQIFIKIFFFQKQVMKVGQVHTQRYQKIKIKMNLINIPFLKDLIIN